MACACVLCAYLSLCLCARAFRSCVCASDVCVCVVRARARVRDCVCACARAIVCMYSLYCTTVFYSISPSSQGRRPHASALAAALPLPLISSAASPLVSLCKEHHRPSLQNREVAGARCCLSLRAAPRARRTAREYRRRTPLSGGRRSSWARTGARRPRRPWRPRWSSGDEDVLNLGITCQPHAAIMRQPSE